MTMGAVFSTISSITNYIAKCFASAIESDKRIQARRLGKSRVIVFDDVDLAFMVEREWEGEVITVFYIVRSAHQKTAYEIHCELQAAKRAPLGAHGPMSALEMQFFSAAACSYEGNVADHSPHPVFV
jgi:hypothetical protein